jgi:SAM-dependent methyltransferase
VPEEQQVVDVERLVEDVRERVAYERSQGDGTGQELAVPAPAPPAYLIAVRPETIVSNKRLVGPLITFVRRVMLRILALPLQDLINQMNTAVAGVHQVVGHESNVRQALIEGEAAAREAGERDLQVVKKRFDGVDTALNALELAHRLAIAEEAEARERALAEEAAARVAEAEVRTRIAGDVEALSQRLAELAARLDRLHAERRFARLERSLRAEAEAQTDAGDKPTPADSGGERVPTLDYLTFEERFRPTDTVHERQETYVELLGDRERVVDLGCGRGELLALLRESGVSSYGVEVERDFIDILRENGLEVVVEDALAHLQRLEAGAVDAVVAIHLIEHLPSSALVGLVQEAARILGDGGILLLETPNPESVLAGSINFHRDPTHERPVHPDTLAFLCENAGFQGVEIRRLSPVPPAERLPAPTGEADSLNAYLDRIVDQLNALLYGFQDYAVVARR